MKTAEGYNPVYWTFHKQTRVGHVLTCLVGVSVFFVVYVYWMSNSAGDLSLLIAENQRGIAARRKGIQIGMIACYLWFSVAFMLGKGAPFLNLTIYPLVILVVGPPIVSFAIFGQAPLNSIAEGYMMHHPSLIKATIITLGPGVFVGFSLTGGFLLILTYVLGANDRWADKHMPPAYHDYARDFREQQQD